MRRDGESGMRNKNGDEGLEFRREGIERIFGGSALGLKALPDYCRRVAVAEAQPDMRTEPVESKNWTVASSVKESAS